MTKRRPVVGQIVRFYAFGPDRPPWAAIVTGVYDSPDLVTLTGFEPGNDGMSSAAGYRYAQVPRRHTHPAGAADTVGFWDWMLES